MKGLTDCQGLLGPGPGGSIRCTSCGEIVHGIRRTAKPAARGEVLPVGMRRARKEKARETQRQISR